MYCLLHKLTSTAPSTAPHNCTAAAVSSTSATVSWVIPEVPNGIVTHYTVTYTALTSLSGISYTEEESGSEKTEDDGTSLVLSGLLKAAHYSIRISASTVAGTGPSSVEECTVLTLEDGKKIRNTCY